MRFTRCIPLLALALAAAVPSTASATAPPPRPDTTVTVDTARAERSLVITTVTQSELVLVRTLVERVIRVRAEALELATIAVPGAAVNLLEFHPFINPADRGAQAGTRYQLVNTIDYGRRSARLHPPLRHREPVPNASTHRQRCQPAILPDSVGRSTRSSATT